MLLRARFVIPIAMFSLLVLSAEAFAASSGMPWETPLNRLLTSLSGPVARVVGAVSIILLGFAVAFSEGGSTVRRALSIVLGLTIAFNAVSWGLAFFGFSGGLAV